MAYKNNRFNEAFIEIIEHVAGIRYLISHSNNLPILCERRSTLPKRFLSLLKITFGQRIETKTLKLNVLSFTLAVCNSIMQ